MLEVLLLPDTFPQYRLLHLIQFAKYVEAHSFWGLCSSWGVGKWTQRSKGVKASGTKCSWAYGMTPWTQQSWAKTLLWPAWLSSKCRPLLAGVTLYSKARRNWRSAVQFWHESALTLTRGSLGLCSLAVMGQPPRIREVSLKVLRLSAPCGSCWSWFAPFVITLRILPLTALWRCEDNSHGPGSLGLKIPYSGQSCSVQLGHEGVLMPSHWWTYHLENLLGETLFLQCSAQVWNSVEVKISFSELLTGKGSAHLQAECGAWGRGSWFPVKVAVSEGDEEVPTLYPSISSSPLCCWPLGLVFAPDKTGLLCPSLSQQVPLGLIHCPAWKQVEASGWVSSLSGFYSTSWCVLSS